MTKANVLESLLSYMMETLVISIQQLSQNGCIVSEDFYLPAPPIYCAQMQMHDNCREDSDQVINSASMESSLRIKLSVICKCTIILLASSNLHVPLIKWYLEQLNLVKLIYYINLDRVIENSPIFFL